MMPYTLVKKEIDTNKSFIKFCQETNENYIKCDILGKEDEIISHHFCVTMKKEYYNNSYHLKEYCEFVANAQYKIIKKSIDNNTLKTDFPDLNWNEKVNIFIFKCEELSLIGVASGVGNTTLKIKE